MAERIVEVEWEDAATTHRWHDETQRPTPSPTRSVGYVTRDDDKAIAVAESLDDTKSETTSVSRFGCETVIPRSAIRKVRELRRGRD